METVPEVKSMATGTKDETLVILSLIGCCFFILILSLFLDRPHWPKFGTNDGSWLQHQEACPHDKPHQQI